MKLSSLIIMITLFFSFSIITIQCAGTQPEDGMDEEAQAGDSQQEDLDDIEQLLGITSDESNSSGDNSAAEESQPKNEQLELLSTGDISKDTESRSSNAYMAAAMADENKKNSVKEVEKLKKEVKKKD